MKLLLTAAFILTAVTSTAATAHTSEIGEATEHGRFVMMMVDEEEGNVLILDTETGAVRHCIYDASKDSDYSTVCSNGKD